MRSPIAARSQEIPPSATVRIADLVSDMRRRGIDVVDFSAGRAAEHTPAYVIEAATRAMQEGDTHQTPAQGKPEFRKACAQKLARDNGIKADPERELIATLGCKQGLFLGLQATLDPGDEVLVEDPGFVSYQPEIQYCGGRAVAVPLPWTAEALLEKRTSKTRGLVLCSPQNPTGVVHRREDLEAIAGFAKEHDLIVYSDETYERLTWDGHEHLSIASLPGMRERTVTLMGLTKSFSMGGWRVGFALAPEPILEVMITVQQHLVTCAGSFAQTGAVAAYGEPPREEVRTLWVDWEKRCRRAAEALDGIPGVHCSMPEGAFYAWADVRVLGEPSATLAERWLEELHVAVVPGSAFGPHGEGYVRITCVRSWEELEKGLSRLRSALC